jgi:anaerobic magnesium-protoporphyrin IX monomethyl ester cyclase
VRVVFATAPDQRRTAEAPGTWPPLALVHLAGTARAAGHECRIVDARAHGLSLGETTRRIAEGRPEVLCLSATTPEFPDALELCRAVQAQGVVTVLGGLHASFMYPEFLPRGGVDYAVVGEGEETLPELLRALESREDPSRIAGLAFPLGGRVVRTARRPRLAVLDPLPLAWDLLDWSVYTWAARPGSRLGSISSSRGCPHPCRGCAESIGWDCTWRPRSPDAVAWDIAQLRREHGVDVVDLCDDAPTWDAARWQELVDLLVELDLGVELLLWTRAEDVVRDARRLPRWRRAGVVHVGLCRDPEEEWPPGGGADDVESGRRAVALLRENGISSETTFWLGFPEESPERIALLQARAREWDPDVAHFRVLAPWPYTPAWRLLGPHVVTRDYRHFNHVDPVVRPRHMSLEQVADAMAACYRGFYLERVRRAERMATEAAEAAHAPGPWQLLLGTPFFRDRVLAGATEEERRALGLATA